MRKLKYFLLASVCLASVNAEAVSIYDNSISAININMLTVEMMNQTHHARATKNRKIYGTMTRLDEYGDNGSTLKTNDMKDTSNNDSLAKDIWFDASHINTRVDYGTPGTTRARYYLATVGFDSLDFDLPVGSIMFGGFFGYINGNVAGFDTNGQTIGLFTRYNYKRFSIGTMLNNGATKNNLSMLSFNNGWLNLAIDASWKIKLQKRLYLEPGIYLGYDYVKTDDAIRINGDIVSTDNFNFWNVSPSVKLIQRVSKNWYGNAFFKYTNIQGGKNDINFQNVNYSGINIKDFSEIGISAEYKYNQFVFGSTIKKLMGNFDGVSGDINIKYLF